MKKNGFTLAEVLMSLAIVGVIAAVTLPSLHLSVEKQKVGPTFMKAINTLESAATFAIRANDVRNLSDINNGGNLFEILEKYAKLTPYSDQVEGDDVISDLINGFTPYVSEDGIRYYGGIYDSTNGYYKVIIDFNGLTQLPNKKGVDQFDVVVLNSGALAVPGTQFYVDNVKKDSKHWVDGCPSIGFGETETKPSDESTCGGSIVENGGRVLYGYSKI